MIRFVCLLCVLSFPVFAQPAPDVYVFPAKVIRVVDGDTLDVSVVLPMGLKWDLRLRVRNIDTPETWRPKTQAEAAHGKQATEYAIDLIQQGPIWVRLGDWGVYNRAQADVILRDLRDYATVMREAGFEKRPSYDSATVP